MPDPGGGGAPGAGPPRLPAVWTKRWSHSLAFFLLGSGASVAFVSLGLSFFLGSGFGTAFSSLVIFVSAGAAAATLT